MTPLDNIDPERDEELGALLRNHLSAPSDAGFAAAVMERLRGDQVESSWDVLARWAPLGMAAAALLGLATGLWLGLDRRDPRTATAATSVVEWFSSAEPVTNDFLLTAVITGDDLVPGGTER